jgi:hypothetical protein
MQAALCSVAGVVINITATLRAMPKLTDMESWTDRLGHTKMRCFTARDGHFWLEQNSAKASKWAKLARQGHEIAWEFGNPGGSYTGRIIIDGEIMTPKEATRRFLEETSP